MSIWYRQKPKKRRTAPNTPLQLLAQKENFALFILKGIHSMAASPALNTVCPFAVRMTIQNAAVRGIEHIKAEQYYRKQKRNSG